jgi:hypothetical protein
MHYYLLLNVQIPWVQSYTLLFREKSPLIQVILVKTILFYFVKENSLNRPDLVQLN